MKLAGATGLEFTKLFKQACKKSTPCLLSASQTPVTNLHVHDVVRHWHDLPIYIQQAILALVAAGLNQKVNAARRSAVA